MKWILGAGREIAVDADQLKYRIEYIRQVTGADVSEWQQFQVNNSKFLYCLSNDIVDGVFITAHNNDVLMLANMQEVYKSKIVIANTCKIEKLLHKNLLRVLYQRNQSIELFFAKQELSIDSMQNFIQTTTLLNVGQFGFQTSLSERELFMHRRKGFEEAIKYSFERVSPIILAGE